ncbi:hypothetical protein D3C87_1524910 [compost metagenome]
MYTFVYEARQDNVSQSPAGGGFYDLYWRYVGTYYGEYVPGQVYDEFSVVISTVEGETDAYLSNKDNNADPVTAVVGENTWKVIGAGIADGQTTELLTWSSQKISDFVGSQGLSNEIIPFDWNDSALTTIAWTDERRTAFGEYPKIEIWKNDPEDPDSIETLVLPGYGVSKTRVDGLVTALNFDVDFAYDDIKTGYYLIRK